MISRSLSPFLSHPERIKKIRKWRAGTILSWTFFGVFLGLACTTKNFTPLDWVYGTLTGFAVFGMVYTFFYMFYLAEEHFSAARTDLRTAKRLRDEWYDTVIPGQNAPLLPFVGFGFYKAEYRTRGNEEYYTNDPKLDEAWIDYVFKVDKKNRENYERLILNRANGTAAFSLPAPNKILIK